MGRDDPNPGTVCCSVLVMGCNLYDGLAYALPLVWLHKLTVPTLEL